MRFVNKFLIYSLLLPLAIIACSENETKAETSVKEPEKQEVKADKTPNLSKQINGLIDNFLKNQDGAVAKNLEEARENIVIMLSATACDSGDVSKVMANKGTMHNNPQFYMNNHTKGTCLEVDRAFDWNVNDNVIFFRARFRSMNSGEYRAVPFKFIKEDGEWRVIERSRPESY